MSAHHRRNARRESEDQDDETLERVQTAAAVVTESLGTSGGLPGLGLLIAPLLGEVFTSYARKRAASLQAAFERLGGRVKQLEENAESNEDLLTAVGQQLLFGRCSKDRALRLAHLMKTGIEVDGLDKERTVELMRLLAELTDEQVLLLCAGTNRFGDDDEWMEKHKRSLGQNAQRLREEASMDLAFTHQAETVLKAKGLIEDERIVRATTFGQMFLREIGLLGADET